MQTTQQAFSAVRGHVTDGCTVIMHDGNTLEIKAVMAGWQILVNGQAWGNPIRAAAVVESVVVEYPFFKP